MNIAFISLSDPTGKSGNNISTKEIISALKKNDKVKESIIVCPKPKNKIPYEIKGILKEKYFLSEKKNRNSLWHLKTQWEILNIFRKSNLYNKVDLVIVRSTLIMIAPIIIAKKKIPFYLLIRGLGRELNENKIVYFYKKIIGNYQLTKAVKKSKKTYIAYREIEQKLSERLNKKYIDSKIEYFTNAINPDLFYSENKINARDKFLIDYPINDNDFLIGFVGSLKPRHCLNEFIEAINLLNKNEKSNFKVIIVGDGPLKDELFMLIKKYDLDKIVYMTGFIPHNQVVHYINTCDIMYGAVSKKFPSNPMKIYEYLACGKPVITTQKKEFEFIKNLNCGYVVNNNNPESIVNAMENILVKSINYLDKMGKRGQKYVLQNHTWDELIKKIIRNEKSSLI